MTSFINNDLMLAEKVEPLEEVVDHLRSTIKANHINRLKSGFCTIEMGFVLSDLLTNLERVSDHCSNIATSVIEVERHGNVDAHGYSRSLTTGESRPALQADVSRSTSRNTPLKARIMVATPASRRMTRWGP